MENAVPVAAQHVLETQRLGRSHPWLGALLEPLDRYLRARQGVWEYTSASECILRIQRIPSDADIFLSDGTQVHRSDPIIDLHFWTEQVPAMPKGGPTFRWARQMDRCFRISLHELARYLAGNPELADVHAIRCNLPLGTARRSDQIARIVGRCGFERVAAPSPQSPSERMHRIGENILISLLVLARNAASLRVETLWRGRTLTYLSRKNLLRRYERPVGPTGAPNPSVRLN